MAEYELKLRHDSDIMRRVSDLNWDLQNVLPGFIIQLQIKNNIVQPNQNSPMLRVTISKPAKFLFKDNGHLLSRPGMGQFLFNILADEGVTVDTNGRFLCHDGLQLLCPEPEASSPLRFPPSLRIHTVSKLVECMLMYFRWMSHSPNKFVPIALDLAIVTTRQFEFHRVDGTLTLGSAESLQFNTFNGRAPATARLVEERIQSSRSEEDCSICLERLGFGQLAARTPCAHTFHRKCIARWLQNDRCCPLCRTPADADGSLLPTLSIS